MSPTGPAITKYQISWNGEALGNVEGLPDDLSFRRMLANRDTANPSPFPRGRIRGIIRDRLFDGLLDQAIQTANAELSAPSKGAAEASTPFRPAAPYNSEGLTQVPENQKNAWLARLLVFEKLLANPDFDQLVREHENKWPWVLSFMDLGKNLPAPKSESGSGVPRADLGNSLQKVSIPLMTAIMWVAPVALGTGLVANHIIDKQSEARPMQAELNNQIDQRLRILSTQLTSINLHLLPTAQTPVLTDTIERELQKIEAAITENTRTIAEWAAKFPTQKQWTAADINSVITNSAANIKYLSPNYSNTAPNVTLTVDQKVFGELENTIKNADQALVKPLDHPITVLLGNERPSDRTSTAKAAAAMESADSGFRLNLRDSHLNLHQDNYPVQNTSLVETNFSTSPFLLIFEPGEVVKYLSQINAPNQEWRKASLELCNGSGNVPYKFVLRKDKITGLRENCKIKNNTDETALEITKEPRLVPEINAYVSLDTASEREYWLWGKRRVVLQIAPAPPKANTKTTEEKNNPPNTTAPNQTVGALGRPADQP